MDLKKSASSESPISKFGIAVLAALSGIGKQIYSLIPIYRKMRSHFLSLKVKPLGRNFKVKQTQKYSKACERLTFPHDTQDELYSELNRLGWFWDSKKKEWLRDDTPAKEVTKLVHIRVWAASEKVGLAAELIIENLEYQGLKLLERSEAYQCRPPKQKESRIYLSFENVED